VKYSTVLATTPKSVESSILITSQASHQKYECVWTKGVSGTGKSVGKVKLCIIIGGKERGKPKQQ